MKLRKLSKLCIPLVLTQICIHAAQLDSKPSALESSSNEANFDLPEARFDYQGKRVVQTLRLPEKEVKVDQYESRKLQNNVDIESDLSLTVYDSATGEPTSIEYNWEVIEQDEEHVKVLIDFVPPPEEYSTSDEPDQIEVSFESDKLLKSNSGMYSVPGFTIKADLQRQEVDDTVGHS